jgi:two-component system sensor histidine kinase/response regulator
MPTSLMSSSPSPPAQPSRRRFLLALGTALLATGAFAVWLGWRVGGDTSVRCVSDVGQVLAALVATVTCRYIGNRHKEQRVFWWLLAGSCGAWMSGQLIWTAYDLAGSAGPPVPSWADVGYLAFIPLAVGALLCHPGIRGSGMRKARSLLDGLAIAVALLFLSWTSVLGPLWRSSDLTTLGGVVTLAYPFGDVVIAFFVVLALHRMTTPDRRGLWFLLAGLIGLALADSTYAYFVHVNRYTTGNLLDTGWFAGFLGIALGALASDARDLRVRADSSWPALPSLVAPLLPMLVALIVAANSIDLAHRPDGVALTMVFALVLLALVRMALLVLDCVATSRSRRPGNAVDRRGRAARPGTIRPERGRLKSRGDEPLRPVRKPCRDVTGTGQVSPKPRTAAALSGYAWVETKSGVGETISATVVVALICASTAISFYDMYLVFKLLAG